MNTSKTLALILLIASSGALYLHTQQKFLPALEILTAKTNDNISIGKLAVAFIVLLFFLSFMNGKQGLIVVITLLAGGMIYSEKVKTNNKKWGYI